MARFAIVGDAFDIAPLRAGLLRAEAGAYATFDEREKGRLDPGQLADLVVLSEDLFAIPPIRIHEARVRLTIFDGRVVYQAPRRP